jgi:hypothetical protein
MGLDQASSAYGLQDWATVAAGFKQTDFLIDILYMLGKTTQSRYILGSLCKYDARLEKRAVYVLTSFIDAHESAQSKLHMYGDIFGEGETAGQQSASAEEEMVLMESREAVR